MVSASSGTTSGKQSSRVTITWAKWARHRARIYRPLWNGSVPPEQRERFLRDRAGPMLGARGLPFQPRRDAPIPAFHRPVGASAEALGSALERFDRGMSYAMNVV